MSRNNPRLAIDLMRQKTAMGADIVSNIDADYGKYSGAYLETAYKIEEIDLLINFSLVPASLIPILKLIREHYNQKRKAEFASVKSDIFTQLSFIQGSRKVVRSGRIRT